VPKPEESTAKRDSTAASGAALCSMSPVRIGDAVSFYDRRRGLPPVIVVQRGIPGDRFRFTLCHELAHLLFHHHKPATVDCESEADLFASEFLAPIKQIRSSLSRIGLDRLVALKAQWGVSMQTLVRVAFDSGLITERQRRTFYFRLARAGFSRSMEPDVVPREEPSFLREVIEHYETELGYSSDELSRMLGLRKSEEFRCVFKSSERELRVVR
jgi:Zn-dependent peptidase ImmA (M78 family)